MTAITSYLAPQTLEEATSLVAAEKTILFAGGTDLLPRWTKGLTSRPEAVADLKRIAALKGVSRVNGEIRVGACTSLSDIATDATIRAAVPVLAEATGRVACPQVRNRATIGGNLCNASPAADTAVPLILLDAVLECASSGPDGIAARQMPITDFFRGPGSTTLTHGEILTHIRFEPPPDGTFAAWDKFGTRRAMEISIASVGVALRLDAGKIVHARVGYGSVAPTPLRGHKAEAVLLDDPLSPQVIDACVAAARDEIEPITDVRAGAAFRREMIGALLRRMLERARSDR